MAWFLCFFFPSKRFLKSLVLGSSLLLARELVWATHELAFTFENADIQTVIKKVGEFTGTTFLFDPKEVKGKITILSPQKVAPEGALKLLESALALHGYTLLRKAEGIWVIPTGKALPMPTVIEVIPLKYAKAEEVAATLAWVAPSGVRIVPYFPTNSLILSGDPKAVEQVIEVLRGRMTEAAGP